MQVALIEISYCVKRVKVWRGPLSEAAFKTQPGQKTGSCDLTEGFCVTQCSVFATAVMFFEIEVPFRGALKLKKKSRVICNFILYTNMSGMS